MRVVVTGAHGQLGRELVEVFGRDHEVIGLGRLEWDVTDPRSPAIVASYQPDLLIHAAAWTDVDGCERDPVRANRVNAAGTRHVAEACRRLEVPLVYLSTDYVFDGTKGEPYIEADPPGPVNVYGRSKLQGEEEVRSRLTRFYIVRTAWLYGRTGRNFVKAILERARRGERLQVVTDQVGSPTYARDLARAIARLVEGAPWGTYHLANAGSCSWYEFARQILTLTDRGEVPIQPITSLGLGRPASRPAYSVLSTGKWQQVTGKTPRHWREALQDGLLDIVGASALPSG
jgi:dTDP-4-dehydrorhamnose reductase